MCVCGARQCVQVHLNMLDILISECKKKKLLANMCLHCCLAMDICRLAVFTRRGGGRYGKKRSSAVIRN